LKYDISTVSNQTNTVPLQTVPTVFNGYAYLTCKNNHNTIQSTVFACSCGWNSKNGISSVQFKPKNILFGDVIDEWEN
jgi:hypothetical protein